MRDTEYSLTAKTLPIRKKRVIEIIMIRERMIGIWGDQLY